MWMEAWSSFIPAEKAVCLGKDRKWEQMCNPVLTGRDM